MNTKSKTKCRQEALQKRGGKVKSESRNSAPREVVTQIMVRACRQRTAPREISKTPRMKWCQTVRGMCKPKLIENKGKPGAKQIKQAGSNRANPTRHKRKDEEGMQADAAVSDESAHAKKARSGSAAPTCARQAETIVKASAPWSVRGSANVQRLREMSDVLLSAAKREEIAETLEVLAVMPMTF